MENREIFILHLYLAVVKLECLGYRMVKQEVKVI